MDDLATGMPDVEGVVTQVRRTLDFEGSGIDLIDIEEVEDEVRDTENVEEVGDNENVEDVEGHEAGDNANVDLIHSKLRREIIPKIGMEFETEEDAYNFYNTYAYGFGFGIRRSKFSRFATGMLSMRLLVCSAEGERGEDKRNPYVKSHQAETRFGCLAKLKIVYQPSSRKYTVVEYVPEHTHMLSTPKKTHMFRSHRKLTPAQIAQANMADALKVLSAKNIKKIPSQYILKRWRKDVKEKSAGVSCLKATDDDEDDPKAKMVRRYRELCRLYTHLATRAAESDGAYEIAVAGLNKTLAEVDACLKKQTSKEASNAVNSTTLTEVASSLTEKTPKDAPPAVNSTPEHLASDVGNRKVRGIKVKERIVKGNSTRPKNALEKAFASKRQKTVVGNAPTVQCQPNGVQEAIVGELEPPRHQLPYPINPIQMQNALPQQMLYAQPSPHIQLQYPRGYSFMSNYPIQMQAALPPQMPFAQPSIHVQPQYLRGYNIRSKSSNYQH